MFEPVGVSVKQGLGSHWSLKEILVSCWLQEYCLGAAGYRSIAWELLVTGVLLESHLLHVYCLGAFVYRLMCLEATGYKGKNLRAIVCTSNEIQTDVRRLMNLSEADGHGG
jgi:hypothetical protein